MGKYDVEEDIPLGDTNSCHSLTLDLVGPDRTVLDVGCATGYLARALIKQGCVVSGVEIDAEAAELARGDLDKLLIADLDDVDLVGFFGEASFDNVIFGDVLEHVRNRTELLRQARRLLRPGGSIVSSIPNVAHGDLALALAHGRWPYAPLGLLDETHIRFFTHESIRRMLSEGGFVPVATHRVKIPVGATEIGIDLNAYPPALLDEVRGQAESETYQFVMRSVPSDGDGAVAALSERAYEAEKRAHEAEQEALDRAAAEVLLQARLADTENVLATVEAERDIRVAEADRARAELRGLRSTRTFRWTQKARTTYGRLRALR